MFVSSVFWVSYLLYLNRLRFRGQLKCKFMECLWISPFMSVHPLWGAIAKLSFSWLQYRCYWLSLRYWYYYLYQMFTLLVCLCLVFWCFQVVYPSISVKFFYFVFIFHQSALTFSFITARRVVISIPEVIFLSS